MTASRGETALRRSDTMSAMKDDLRRLIWTDCSMRGEGVHASGLGQGITFDSLFEHYAINANGVDYEVVVEGIERSNGGTRWEVVDVGSHEGRSRV